MKSCFKPLISCGPLAIFGRPSDRAHASLIQFTCTIPPTASLVLESAHRTGLQISQCRRSSTNVLIELLRKATLQFYLIFLYYYITRKDERRDDAANTYLLPGLLRSFAPSLPLNLRCRHCFSSGSRSRPHPLVVVLFLICGTYSSRLVSSRLDRPSPPSAKVMA
jgi:hypothetical protein